MAIHFLFRDNTSGHLISRVRAFNFAKILVQPAGCCQLCSQGLSSSRDERRDHGNEVPVEMRMPCADQTRKFPGTNRRPSSVLHHFLSNCDKISIATLLSVSLTYQWVGKFGTNGKKPFYLTPKVPGICNQIFFP